MVLPVDSDVDQDFVVTRCLSYLTLEQISTYQVQGGGLVLND